MKLIRNISYMVLFALLLSVPTLSGEYGVNNQGEFYLSEGVVYFKGTMNGQTYSDFVKITGSESVVDIDSRIVRGNVADIFVDNDAVGVLTDRGVVYSLGVNAQSIFGGSPSKADEWKFAAGSILDKIDTVYLTQGNSAVYQQKDGGIAITNTTDDGSSFGSYINSELTEKLVNLNGTKLAITDLGNLYIGETNVGMTAVSELSGINIKDIQADASNGGSYWILSNDGKLYSSANGQNWTLEKENVANYFIDNGTKYVMESSGVVYSTSGSGGQSYAVEGTVPDITGVKSISLSGSTLVVHKGNDLYSLDADSFDHNYMIQPTYDDNGFDLWGIHKDTGTEFGPDGLTVDGDAYDSSGWDMNGYDSDGFDADGYNSSGFDANGLSANGIDMNGFDIVTGLHQSTGTEFDSVGLTVDGDPYDSEGYDVNGNNASGFNRDGIHFITGTEFDESGNTIDGDAFDGEGYTVDGYDANGYDRDGFNSDGINASGFHSSGIHTITNSEFDENGMTVDGDEFDSNFLTSSGSEFGLDNLTYLNQVYGSDGRDYQGHDEGGFLVDGTHKNGTMYDDAGFNMAGWSPEGVHKDGISAKNGHFSKDFALSHAVARESYFKTVVSTARIDTQSLSAMLGTITVKSNTRDGFKISLVTASNGKLVPQSNEDGEVDIPYGIQLKYKGDIGAGVDSKFTFESGELANGQVDILWKAGSAVGSSTNLIMDLNVNVETSADLLGMAGTYEDVITLTFEDL